MGRILWLASYPKAGNTWVRTFMINLAVNRPEPVPFEQHPQICAEEPHMRWYRDLVEGDVNDLSMRKVSAVRARAQERIARTFQQNILVKTHSANFKMHGYSQINKAVTSGAIYVVRNPLDLTISYADHMGLSIDDAITNLANFNTVGYDKHRPPSKVPEILSDWSSHVKSWTAKPNPRLHVVRYEDLIDRPQETFGQLAAFLGYDIENDPERLTRAISNSSFNTLQQIEDKGGFGEKSSHAKRFFREGRKDQWCEVLSKRQVRRITDQHRQQMDRFGYV